MTTSKRAWVILEKRGDQLIPLAGTEDEKAINRALNALKQYKDERIRLGGIDLTDIRSTVVESLECQAIEEVLEQDKSDRLDNLLSMVSLGDDS
jgi:hypothetical protein